MNGASSGELGSPGSEQTIPTTAHGFNSPLEKKSLLNSKKSRFRDEAPAVLERGTLGFRRIVRLEG